MAPTMAITQWARFEPKLSSRVLASRSAPPDSSRIFPSIPPSPMIAIRKPSVPPIPDSSVLIIFETGIPAPKPTTKQAITKARNA
ncbi:hypothetical protein D3C75_1192130 [compost metagenome]